MKYRVILLLTALTTLVVGCRKKEMFYVAKSTEGQVTEGMETSRYKGFFLLNEGNMGSNKATLDYFDYASGVYTRNIYAERNPNVARELGDVGNDLKIHGERLYAVINCSNLVEVMQLTTAKHIGEVAVAGGRYIAFDDKYGYVSSYAGALGVGPARKGCVVRFNLETLATAGQCEVGYQPEQMAIYDGKLYVANSGGYRATGEYDNRLSIIDLETFSLIKHIEIADNLYGVVLAPNNKIYVSAWGTESATYIVDPKDDTWQKIEGLANTKMSLANDGLYILSGEFGAGVGAYTLYDTLTSTILESSLINDGTAGQITQPHTIAANAETYEFFVTDAKDYVTPGEIIAYDANGNRRWSTMTGDIPSAIAFTPKRLLPLGQSDIEQGDGVVEQSLAGFTEMTRVVEYAPAPGQYVSAEVDCAAALEALKGKQYVSLGGWGGSIIVEFEGDVLNRDGADIAIRANQMPTSNEPGIVWVLSEGVWYELKGSEYANSTLNHSKTYPNGTTFTGTLLPNNVEQNASSGFWAMKPFDWGYVDNTTSFTAQISGQYNLFEIDNAVDNKGNSVALQAIEQVKVQCGVDASAGDLGEVSTEVFHFKARTIEPSELE